MGSFYAVHLAAGCNLQRIRELVERVTGEMLKESYYGDDGPIYETICNTRYFTSVEDFGDESSFFDHAGIPLSRLPVMVSFEPYKTTPGADERRELCRGVALRVARALFEDLQYDCVVSDSMEERVATFKTPGKASRTTSTTSRAGFPSEPRWCGAVTSRRS